MTQAFSKVYLPVNWTDGMKINKYHFRSEQQASSWQQSFHSRALLNDFNYGLFPQEGAGPVHRQLSLLSDNQQQVVVRVSSCCAVTRGGHIIHFEESATARENMLSIPVDVPPAAYGGEEGTEKILYVVLAVDPFNRQPVGQPDVEETQMRPPFTAPSYSLQLVAPRDIQLAGPGNFHLPVGKIRVSEGKVLPDETYIPPCTCPAAHSATAGAYGDFVEFFSAMEIYVLQIQQKIVQKRQQNNLASVIMEICDKMNVYMSAEYQRFLLEYNSQPPVCMIRSLAGLARLTKNSIDIYTGTLKDELLAYFSEWCGIMQGDLEAVSTALCNHRYDHLEIREALNLTQRFTKLVLHLFSSLAALEYIGKKREAGIFVKEHMVVPGEEAPVFKRKSFLAD